MTSLPTALRRAAAMQSCLNDPVTAGCLEAAADRIEVLEAGYDQVMSASRDLMAAHHDAAEALIREIGGAA